MRIRKLTLALAIMALGFCGCKSSQKAAESKNSPLVGTQWQLESISNQLVADDSFASQPYIIFNDDGTFAGNLGCNSFFGNYYQKKQKMTVDFSGATKKLCTAMDTEKAFLKGLKAGINHFEITDKTLILYAGKEEIFRFKDNGKFLEE